MPKMWNQLEVQKYIDNGIEENLNLEYKGAAALNKTDAVKKEITKDVSAMANSAGGILIYGIAEYSLLTICRKRLVKNQFLSYTIFDFLNH